MWRKTRNRTGSTGFRPAQIRDQKVFSFGQRSKGNSNNHLFARFDAESKHLQMGLLQDTHILFVF
jgi:hypothetical protein